MNLGLINSAWLGSPIGTAEGIRKTKEIGFDTIDIFADPLEADVKERKLIRDTCREVGLPVVSVCCVALGLADFNRSVRQFHAERVRRYLDFVYELEGRNLLLVLGEYIWQQEVIQPQDQWRWAVEEVRALGEYAASLGLEVALELEPFRLSIINSVDRMKAFLEEVAYPSVKANLDISHLALVHTPAERIGELEGRIAHVHFSDCDGVKHGDLPPGRGVVDFLPYLRAIQQTGFDGTLSIELEYSPEPDKILEWVTEAYRETDRLMREAGFQRPRASA
ncbi:MAG: sugar phosphate isomerase/epimerase [Bryobacterales bacterium]|nr:sugar phosphate isomerase/epimerase [Bryobacteraceae bacterium]MDW8355834.1 sugar phosphate isomerase/epimerase [Bryobacterales bacterium]